VPFIRQSRDKRGFEYTYVMHTYHPGAGGQQRPRLLYLFRSPSSVRLGRTALDAEVMEALEHTHPDLSFDWQVLSREAAATRIDNSGERQQAPPQRRPGQRGPGQRTGGPRPDQQQPRSSGSSDPGSRNQGIRTNSPGASSPGSNFPGANSPGSKDPGLRTPVEPINLPPDDSVLGKTLGVAEAARMRRRYAELLQRIARRARSPEDRERLTERLQRLNPEDWSDEAGVRANAPAADAGWNAISAELPSRRRGRRGGRGRADAEARPSGIMASERQNTAEAGDDGPEETHNSGAGDADGGLGAVRTVAADSDSEAPTDPDLPVGD